MRHLLTLTTPTSIALAVLFYTSASLNAAVDPDLFDGGIVVPQSSSSESSDSGAEASGATEASEQGGAQQDSATAAGESRDMNQVDGVTPGDPVSAESSKTSEDSSSSGRDFSQIGQTGGGRIGGKFHL
jgi:hypothetical protein